MKRFALSMLPLLILAAAAVVAPPAGRRASIDPSLLEQFETLGPTALVPLNIILSDQADAEALLAENRARGNAARRSAVTDALRALAEQTQSGILDRLRDLEQTGDVSDVSRLWIVNALHASATRRAVESLATREDIRGIAFDRTAYALTGFAGIHRSPGAANDDPPIAGAGSSSPLPAAADTAWGVQWIGAPDVWRAGYRGRGVIVAILDTGIWYPHTDLAGRMWINPREIAGDGIDNDRNGYVDDIYGYDFHGRDSDPIGLGGGHGTHVAGTVAGDGSGGILTGVAPEASLMAVKVLDDWGYGNEWDAWEGIQYAVDNRARVLQGSIGWIHDIHNPDRNAWRDLCDNVLAAGAIMSFAAGNERGWYPPPDDIRTPSDCPSPWRNPDQPPTGGVSAVVAVGATGYRSDESAGFSSVGPATWTDVGPWFDYPLDPGSGLIKPDVCAPGEHINSTVTGGGYSGDTWDGTSMATPHNSGLIALMLSKNLAMTPEQVDEILQTTALDLGPAGKDNEYGAGRIRAAAAVAAVPELAGVTIALSPSDTVAVPGGAVRIAVTLTNATSKPVTFDVWGVAETAWNRRAEWFRPTAATIGPLGTIRTQVRIPVLESTPAGVYHIVGIAGGYPAQVMSRDSFPLRVGAIAPR